MFKDFSVRTTLFILNHFQNLKDNFVDSLKKLKKALSQESEETKEMLNIYYRFTHGKSSPEEMEAANAQFRDILKTLGLSTFAVLPFAPITIPFIVKVGKKLGIDILPSAFQDEKTDEDLSAESKS